MSSLQVRLQPGREGVGVNILRIFQTESGPPPWSEEEYLYCADFLYSTAHFLESGSLPWSDSNKMRRGEESVYVLLHLPGVGILSLVRLTPGGIPDSCKILDSADSKLVGRKGGVLLQLPTP